MMVIRETYRHMFANALLQAAGVAFCISLLSGCSLFTKPRTREDIFLSQFNVRSGVRYPDQASSVLHTVAGHMALASGGLPEAERYFDEVARLSVDAPVDLDLTRADIALQLGDLKSALAALKTIEIEKLDNDEKSLLAALNLEQGDLAKSIELYQHLVTTLQNSEIQGKEKSESGEAILLDDATAFLMLAKNIQEPALRNDCESLPGPISYLVCGRINERRGNLEQALVYYRLASERAPELRSMQLDQYRVLLKLGREDEVLLGLKRSLSSSQAKDIQRILRSAPPGSAVGLLREIERLSPGNLSTADLRGKIAALELRASRPKSALRQLSLVLAIEPDNDSARYLRASLLASAGRRQEARNDLLIIKPEQQGYGQARLLAAQLSRLEGKLEQAQTDLRPYVDTYPGDKLGVLTYLSLLKEQGKYSEGLSLIAALQAGKPSTVNWLGLEKAYLLKSLGRDEEALAAAEEVLAAEEDNAPAQNFIAYELATQSRDLDRARDLAERAVNSESDEPFYVDTLGWVMFKRGNLERAKELLTKALDLSRGDIVIAEHLGDVLEAIRAGDGQAVYRNALENARDNERSVLTPEERAVRERLEKKVTK